jgi:site-specific recombinase XerD
VTETAEATRVDSSHLPANVVRVPGAAGLYIRVPTTTGIRRRIATGLPDDRDGRRMAGSALALLESLSQQPLERRRLLDALHDRRVSLFPSARRPGPALYDVLNRGGMLGADELLAALETRATDVDLVPVLDSFRGNRDSLHPRKRGQMVTARVRENDAASVRAALDSMHAAAGGASADPVRLRSLVTPERVRAYLDGLLARERQKKPGIETAGRSARRKHHLALATFWRFATTVNGVTWPEDPTAAVVLTATPAGRILHLERWECELLAATLDEEHAPHGDYSRVLHGTGLDTTDVARLTVRDVDRHDRRLNSLSGKTFNRGRRPLVLDWAWPAVERRTKGKKPSDRLFPEIPPDRHAHSKTSAEVCAALTADGHAQFRGYQPRDARHSVAVQMLAAGVPVTAVAEQLGHDPATLLRTYARWIPKASEVDTWRRLMQERDARMEGQHPPEETDDATP